MDEKELRIGNYLNNDGKIIKVESLDPTKDFEELSCAVQFKHFENGRFVWYDCTWLDYLSPIPLTEEILIKAGFYYSDDEHDYLQFDVFRTFKLYADRSDNFSTVEYRINDTSKQIKELHKLQNFIYDHMDAELQINL